MFKLFEIFLTLEGIASIYPSFLSSFRNISTLSVVMIIQEYINIKVRIRIYLFGRRGGISYTMEECDLQLIEIRDLLDI